MTPFYGNYDVTIDEKHRLLVPAEIRRAIDPAVDGEAFFMIRGINRKPWLYPEKHYVALASQMRSELAPEEDVLAFDRWHFGTATRLEWDKQGRILIPERTIRKAELTRDVTVVGMRDHVEIWNRAEWAAQEDELDRRQPEIAMQARRRLEQISRPPAT